MVTNETVDSPPDMLTDTDYLASEIHQVRSDIKEMAMDNRVNDVEQNKKLLEISNKLDAIEKSISKDNSKEIRSAGCQKEQESDMPVPRCEKEFVLKHVFKDVTNFKEDVYNDGGKEEHFNVNWYTAAKRHSNRLGLYVVCLPVSPSIKWSIQTKLELKAVGRNQNDVIKTRDHCYEESQGYGFSEFLEWEKMENEYLLDGNLTVEAKVTIIETSGFRKEENRKFDESNVSDVVLVVRDTKFHVLKAYLASQSSFFQSLFTENPTKSEFSSTGIDPNDFHCFLETLYGEYAIDGHNLENSKKRGCDLKYKKLDSNVEGVLLLADRLDSPMVKRRCEVFLLKESKKTLVKKQQMANCYHLQNWVI
ncbi:hypothetical protein B9Z55_007785 [Caenorhabditis nigoni]|uniref:BTB domain-containing protein n=1 Tax=Caenorhabditis nigoni TaxID=1611254 RepID=A0A2G5VBE7_9PELO|nr:hypothetical protein B9Z55_007785 [Caenorhabditis nigoni]